ncbi:MAG: hypothetical protein R3D26_17640 [Cyanobacteriota/Melainabacteria group bacterium]
MISFLLLLVCLVAMVVIAIAMRRFIKRVRRLKVLEGAAFWLTSFFLCLIFVGFGILWGFWQ